MNNNTHFEEKLRSAGLRSTKQRLKMCEILFDRKIKEKQEQKLIDFMNSDAVKEKHINGKYKLCELLNEKEFLPYFPMLKDRDKRIEQDEIWKNICKELNWQFIPTL